MKKIKNYHLFILILIVFILNTILFRSIDITKAQWQPPSGVPGEGTANIVTNPLQEDLNLGGYKIIGDGSIDVVGQGIMSTFDFDIVSANGTQARESEVARLYYNVHHWIHSGVTTVEIFDRYFGGGGYLKYHVRAGNSNSYEIQLMEAHGHTSQMQLVFGTPVDTGGDYSGYDNY